MESYPLTLIRSYDHLIAGKRDPFRVKLKYKSLVEKHLKFEDRALARLSIFNLENQGFDHQRVIILMSSRYCYSRETLVRFSIRYQPPLAPGQGFSYRVRIWCHSAYYHERVYQSERPWDIWGLLPSESKHLRPFVKWKGGWFELEFTYWSIKVTSEGGVHHFPLVNSDEFLFCDPVKDKKDALILHYLGSESLQRNMAETTEVETKEVTKGIFSLFAKIIPNVVKLINLIITESELSPNNANSLISPEERAQIQEGVISFGKELVTPVFDTILEPVKQRAEELQKEEKNDGYSKTALPSVIKELDLILKTANSIFEE